MVEQTFLESFPTHFWTDVFLFAAPKPNLNSYVFLRANQKQEQVLIEPELEDDQK